MRLFVSGLVFFCSFFSFQVFFLQASQEFESVSYELRELSRIFEPPSPTAHTAQQRADLFRSIREGFSLRKAPESGPRAPEPTTSHEDLMAAIRGHKRGQLSTTEPEPSPGVAGAKTLEDVKAWAYYIKQIGSLADTQWNLLGTFRPQLSIKIIGNVRELEKLSKEADDKVDQIVTGTHGPTTLVQLLTRNASAAGEEIRAIESEFGQSISLPERPIESNISDYAEKYDEMRKTEEEQSEPEEEEEDDEDWD